MTDRQSVVCINNILQIKEEIKTAEKLFNEKGFARTSVESIIQTIAGDQSIDALTKMKMLLSGGKMGDEETESFTRRSISRQ